MMIHKKQTIILFAGPDMCGKTNIAHALGDRLNIPVFKASSEHKTFLGSHDAFIEQLRYADPRMIDILKQTGYSIILDRGYPCEKTYSEFFKRATDYKALKYVDESFAALNAKIIICTRKSFKGIVDDLDSRLDENALYELSQLYVSFTEWTTCKTHVLYVDDFDVERQLQEISMFLNDEEKDE